MRFAVNALLCSQSFYLELEVGKSPPAMRPLNQSYHTVVQALPHCTVMVLRTPGRFALGRSAHGFALSS